MRYIAIDGPLGVGKRSFIDGLSNVLASRCIFDERNPFLLRFYENMEKFAFQTQLFFLVSRHQQQQDSLQSDLFSQYTLCDYVYEKSRLFASLTLQEQEFALYEKVQHSLGQTSIIPDCVIYLQASTDYLLKQLKQSRSDLSLRISSHYLDQVVQAYQTFFFHYKKAPVIVCNVEQFDFINNEDNKKRLLKQIHSQQPGLHYLSGV